MINKDSVNGHEQSSLNPEDSVRGEGITTKSEEVQSIIDRMPTYWVKWVALCIGVLMGVIVLLGFLIQYSDTVDGQISVTATTAPVRLVANNNGRINLLQNNKTLLQKGDVISYIESAANYKHILWVDSLLRSINNSSSIHLLPDTLLLGEVSSAYNAFLLSYLQYERLLTSDIYATMRKNLQQQIQSDEAVITNLKSELQLKKQVLNNSQNQLEKDSILLSIKGISEQEYQNRHTAHLSLQESYINLQSNRLMKSSEISRNHLKSVAINWKFNAFYWKKAKQKKKAILISLRERTNCPMP